MTSCVFPLINRRGTSIEDFAELLRGQEEASPLVISRVPIGRNAKQMKEHPASGVLVSMASLKEMRSASCFLKNPKIFQFTALRDKRPAWKT